MDQENYNKQYELSYHLAPELEGADILVKVEEINKIINQNQGKIIHSQEPQKKHLSYPINLKHYGNFGILEFQAPGESLEKINSQMKLVSDLMRYLLVQSISGKKILKTLTPSRRKSKPKGADSVSSAQSRLSEKERKEQGTVAAGEIEKQLEEVIEKL